MKFSLLMSVYHKDNPIHLKSALISVLSNTVIPDEIVLVQDGPLPEILNDTINTVSKLHSYFKIVRLNQQSGPADAWNAGLKNVSFNYVARMDSDDICENNRFEIQTNFLTNHPDVDIVGSFCSEFDDNDNIAYAVRKVPTTHEEIINFSKLRNPMNHPTVIYRRSAVERAGLYKKHFGFVDYYLWIRMIINGSKFSNIPLTLVKLRAGSELMNRRGGLKYIKSELKFQYSLYCIGFLNSYEFSRNVAFRSLFRILPSRYRLLMYNTFLRNKPK